MSSFAIKKQVQKNATKNTYYRGTPKKMLGKRLSMYTTSQTKVHDMYVVAKLLKILLKKFGTKNL